MMCMLVFFFLMIRRPPRSTQSRSSAASDVYKRQAGNIVKDGSNNIRIGWFGKQFNGCVDISTTTEERFQIQNTSVGMWPAKIGKLAMRKINHEERKVDCIGDGSLFDGHEVLHAPELFSVAEVELDLEAQAIVVNQGIVCEFEITAEKHRMCADATLQIGFDQDHDCLLYTSDAADDLLCVDLGGPRIIKKKNKNKRNFITNQ